MLILTACARSVLMPRASRGLAALRVMLPWRKWKDVNLADVFVFSILEPWGFSVS